MSVRIRQQRQTWTHGVPGRPGGKRPQKASSHNSKPSGFFEIYCYKHRLHYKVGNRRFVECPSCVNN